MTHLDIARERLRNQHIAEAPFENPAEAVQWLGAVQSQDYAGAKWALGQRVRGATDAAIEHAFAQGTILRTHVLRPTWHFVTPADIRWMLALTAPRVKTRFAYANDRLGLDEAIFARSNALLERALQGGKQLTRTEVVALLQRAGLATDDSLRSLHIMAWAELDGIVCSGARRGKQPTYALLDERAPQARSLEREAALAELARRYFTSHGPATLKDYVWWSGLTAADARAGLEMTKAHLVREVVDGDTCWLAASGPASKAATLQTLDPLTAAQTRAVTAAARRYGEFLGMPVTLG